jgi:hypothetical protein
LGKGDCANSKVLASQSTVLAGPLAWRHQQFSARGIELNPFLWHYGVAPRRHHRTGEDPNGLPRQDQ